MLLKEESDIVNELSLCRFPKIYCTSPPKEKPLKGVKPPPRYNLDKLPYPCTVLRIGPVTAITAGSFSHEEILYPMLL